MKTALVTGGSRGIGAAICKTLTGDGWYVIVNYLNSCESAERLAAEIGGRAVYADVRNADAVTAMLQSTGDIDALVTSAAITSYGVFQEISAGWRDIFDTNVGGVINCVNAVLPSMLRRKNGSIVTISSIWGTEGASCESIYSASKHAVIGLTKSLAKELAPSGIRVNSVSPGIIAAGMTAAQFRDPNALTELMPMGRLGTAEEVAAVAAFLCSDKASYITGQIIGVDGGMT